MVKIKELVIGEGMPKICVPIVGTTQEEILDKAQEILQESVDIVEWRIDFYTDVEEEDKVVQTADLLQSILGKIPLLVTFRTAKEGGERAISFEKYEALLNDIAKSGKADAIDVEMFRGYDDSTGVVGWNVADACNQKMLELVESLSKNVTVIGSYHDFYKTPNQSEIAERLSFMDKMGVAIPKMAVMPQSREDVIALMDGTMLAKSRIANKPVITMSMGDLGKISRIAGESFGSAVTFGCLGQASAPGQIAVGELKKALELLHCR